MLFSDAEVRCIQVMEPIARLVQHGVWSFLPFRGSWCTQVGRVGRRRRNRAPAVDRSILLFPDWPSDEWFPDLSMERLSDLFIRERPWGPDRTRTLHANLCAAAPGIIAAVPQARDLLTQLACQLQSGMDGQHLSWLRWRLVDEEALAGRCKFSDDGLLNAYRLGFLMRDNKTLFSRIELVFTLCMGSSAIDEDRRRMQMLKRFVPSPYTLRFAELQVDGAFMLWWARYAQKSQLWYFAKLDASPQAGLELLASEVDVVAACDLVSVADAVAVWEMTGWSSEYGKHPSRDPLGRDRPEFGRFIANAFRRHLRPLQVLGSKRATLEHKVMAWLSSFRLETASTNSLVQDLHRVVSFCTDMGTELGVADFVCKGVDAALPPWRAAAAPSALQADVDDVGSDAAVAVVAAPPAERQPDHLLPLTFVAPDILHIVSNALEDMAADMQHWSPFVQQLKQVCRTTLGPIPSHSKRIGELLHNRAAFSIEVCLVLQLVRTSRP